MNDQQQDMAGSVYQIPRKEYVVAPSKPKAFMVEDAQWDRIHDRVQALEAKGGVDWLMAGGTMVGGIAASAGLALLALPKATTKDGQLASSVKPILWAIFLGGMFVTIVMALLWRHLKENKSKIASDICNEMDTIQAAWQERESADGSV